MLRCSSARRALARLRSRTEARLNADGKEQKWRCIVQTVDILLRRAELRKAGRRLTHDRSSALQFLRRGCLIGQCALCRRCELRELLILVPGKTHLPRREIQCRLRLTGTCCGLQRSDLR